MFIKTFCLVFKQIFVPKLYFFYNLNLLITLMFWFTSVKLNVLALTLFSNSQRELKSIKDEKILIKNKKI